MLVLYGTRTSRIKKYTDNQHCCKSCGAFEIEVQVSRSYFHVFFIPVVPVGFNTVLMRCGNCQEPFRLQTLQTQYENKSKAPFYFYSIPILLAVLIAIIINLNITNQKEKAKFIESPKIGDIYKIRKDENSAAYYYFLRVSKTIDDTVFVYHNNILYNSFITQLIDVDFFDSKEELIFTKKELKEKLNNGEINAVEREYSNETGFNRIK